eukprot:symbB.v1.2.013920.t1/scaffold996.1/size145880/1
MAVAGSCHFCVVSSAESECKHDASQVAEVGSQAELTLRALQIAFYCAAKLTFREISEEACSRNNLSTTESCGGSQQSVTVALPWDQKSDIGLYSGSTLLYRQIDFTFVCKNRIWNPFPIIVDITVYPDEAGLNNLGLGNGVCTCLWYDVMQNHLLQLLTLVLMEAPASLDPEDVRDEKVKVLKQFRAVKREDCVVGQYDGYQDDPAIQAINEKQGYKSKCPTFAACVLHLDNERWSNVPIIMKAGKSLERRSTIVCSHGNIAKKSIPSRLGAMIRAYYFHEKATDVIKEELKKNFCSLSVEYGRTSTTMTPGTKGGISYMAAVDRDKLSIIITCRNTRDVIGEKGSRLRLLTHKINGCFGFNEDFVQLYVQKHGPLYDVEDVDDKVGARKGKGKGRKGKGYVMDDGEEEEPIVQAKVNVKAKPPQRHEVPDFDSEQWKECAWRCAKLGEALKDEKTFAPINMILRDPLRYGLRLWREYNLRARPMEFREIESPLDLCETQDIGDEYIDEWSVGMDPSDGWGSPPQDLDWSAPVDLTEEQKKAARAKRFGASNVKAMCWNQPPDLTWAQALKAYIVIVFLFAVLCIAFFASPMAQPKKPTGGAYGQFLVEKRAEFQKHCEGQRVTAVTKLAGEKFRALSEEEKAVYQKKFQEAQAKYEIDMKAFLDAGGEKKTTQRKGKASKEKKGNKVKDPEAPKKPAGGGYGCFLAKNRAAFQKECVGQPVTAVTKLASIKWKELNAEEKKIYEDEYQAKKEAYQEAMKSYVPKAVPEAEEGEVEEAPVKKARTEKAAVKVPKATDKATANKASKAKANTLKAEVELQATVAAKAEKLGLKDGLLKLAARPDVKASGKSQGDMLKALEEHGGLLHPAKRALLGA